MESSVTTGDSHQQNRSNGSLPKLEEDISTSTRSKGRKSTPRKSHITFKDISWNLEEVQSKSSPAEQDAKSSEAEEVEIASLWPLLWTSGMSFGETPLANGLSLIHGSSLKGVLNEPHSIWTFDDQNLSFSINNPNARVKIKDPPPPEYMKAALKDPAVAADFMLPCPECFTRVQYPKTILTGLTTSYPCKSSQPSDQKSAIPITISTINPPSTAIDDKNVESSGVSSDGPSAEPNSTSALALQQPLNLLSSSIPLALISQSSTPSDLSKSDSSSRLSRKRKRAEASDPYDDFLDPDGERNIDIGKTRRKLAIKPWDNGETLRLKVLVAAHPSNKIPWESIATQLSNEFGNLRNAVQCEDQYYSVESQIAASGSRRWTAREDAKLKALLTQNPSFSVDELSVLLGRSSDGINNRIEKLGIKNSAPTDASPASSSSSATAQTDSSTRKSNKRNSASPTPPSSAAGSTSDVSKLSSSILDADGTDPALDIPEIIPLQDDKSYSGAFEDVWGMDPML